MAPAVRVLPELRASARVPSKPTTIEEKRQQLVHHVGNAEDMVQVGVQISNVCVDSDLIFPFKLSL